LETAIMAKGARILLADDEEDFLRYTAALFQKEGYECDCVTDGYSAVEKLKKRRYDAVISDIRMPGNADLRLARETARLQDGVPVILVTAYPSTDTAIPAVSLPVKAYVEKPVEFGDLLATVDGAILESRGLREAGVCSPGRCDRTGWFVKVLSAIADDLMASRSAFRSRRLGQLRNRIEETVKQLKSELH
jgi:DNA-binding NtrC family response regulator